MTVRMKTPTSPRRFSSSRAAFVIASLVWLAGCGGRVSHPVEAVTDHDDRLSCDQLRAERRVNDSRMADLRDEKQNAEMNNVGLVVVSPLFFDLSSSEGKEIVALAARNQTLDALIAKRCPAT